MTQQFSVSPDGTKYPLPTEEDYKKEFERVNALVEEARRKGQEIVVVMGLGFVGSIMAYLYNIPTTGLRFFTVYSPWGRPDMAYFSFTKAIMEDKPIKVFNYGRMQRDFTYIDDIIECVVRIINKIPKPNPNWDRKNPGPGSSYAPYKLYNIGNSSPVELIKFIEILENNISKKAQKNMLPMQPGDVPITYADIDDLMKDVGFKPTTPIEEGIKRFVEWYIRYYG